MGHTLFETSLGPSGIAWTERGIVAVQLPAESAEATREALLAHAQRRGAASQATEAEPDQLPAWIAAAAKAIAAQIDGEDMHEVLRALPLDDASVPAFYRRVYAALREVSPGATTTYGELARAVGSPGAARAVGAAMASNPFVIVVPCHRVLAAAGAMGGFSAPGGAVTKRRLLAAEGARLEPEQRTLF